jgi:uncharacterized membrane protein
MSGELALFHAFQVVLAFALLPVLIVWLSSADFNGAYLAMTVACLAYSIVFLWIVVAVAMMFEKK